MKKQRNKPKLEDISKRQEAYKKKIKEYSKNSLEELKEIFNNKRKRIGGIYRAALIEVVKGKLQEQAIASNEVVSEIPTINSSIEHNSSNNTIE